MTRHVSALGMLVSSKFIWTRPSMWIQAPTLWVGHSIITAFSISTVAVRIMNIYQQITFISEDLAILFVAHTTNIAGK